MIRERFLAHHHHQLGAGRDGRRCNGEDRLTRDAVLREIAADGPASLVAIGFLRLALCHRCGSEFGDAPAWLIVVRLRFDQGEIGRLTVGGLQSNLEGAEHEVAVEGAAEALARMRVVGQGFEAYGGQEAWRRRGFDHVGFLSGGTARDEPRTIFEAFEFSIFLGCHFLVGQRLPGHAFFREGCALTVEPLREEFGLGGRDGF